MGGGGRLIEQAALSFTSCRHTPVYLGLVRRRHLELVAGHAQREEAEHHGHGREGHRGGVVAGREPARLRPPVVTDDHDDHQFDGQRKAGRSNETVRSGGSDRQVKD